MHTFLNYEWSWSIELNFIFRTLMTFMICECCWLLIVLSLEPLMVVFVRDTWCASSQMLVILVILSVDACCYKGLEPIFIGASFHSIQTLRSLDDIKQLQGGMLCNVWWWRSVSQTHHLSWLWQLWINLPFILKQLVLLWKDFGCHLANDMQR